MSGDECLRWKVRMHEKIRALSQVVTRNGGRRGEKLDSSMLELMQDGQFHFGT